MSSPRTPTCFVRPGRPATANKAGGSRGPAFGEELRRLFRDAGGEPAGEALYGVVYHFVRGYQPATDADADNISKPVWDVLKGAAYSDDKLVRLRIAGIVDVPPFGGDLALLGLDPSGVPAEVEDELAGFVRSDERHAPERSLLYVELGPLRRGMFRLGLAARGQA